jgi:hypothetical protein
MKAIVSRALAMAVPALGLLLTSACSEQRVIPAPQPRPTSTPAPPPPRPSIDWREARATPGDWVWSNAGGGSSASFAQGLFTMRCQQGSVVIARRGSGEGPVPMSISTSAMTRTLSGAGSASEITATLTARDPLLDAMAFSRGHFAVEVAGLAPLYVPSWPEVSRVIEDCR